MPDFEIGESTWISRLGNLRNVVRQELISRQLSEHVHPGDEVLDVGCGQGTQALRLAVSGCVVTGVDASENLLSILRQDAAAASLEVDVIHAELDQLESSTSGRKFDVVCAHGLLMYLDKRVEPLRLLVNRLRPGGLLSLTFRNAAALAFRPGMRGKWQDALDAFDTTAYVNELGLSATADHLEDVIEVLATMGVIPVAWYGVRVFTDATAPDVEAPSVDDLAMLLEVEDRAGRLDPFRALGSQLHLIASLQPTDTN